MADRFPSPFEIETPAGAEGWQELYTYSLPFSTDRREYEDSMFWFQDGVHWPEVMSPWDATFYEFALASLSQYNTRHYLIPPALGVDYRVLNGYAYLSPVGVADPAEIEARVPHFLERAGFYFQNWATLYEQWMGKIRGLIGEMEALSFEPLPDKEDLAVVTEGRGMGSGFELQRSYHRLVDLALQLWQYHFEFLNLGYAAYLDFFGFCKQAFPSIPDLAIAKMVAGVEVDLFQPDEELKKLARLAVDSRVDDAFERPSAAEVIEALRGSDAGQAWLSQWEASAQPWFNFSAGSGFYHTDEVWLEHLEIPFGFVRDYIAKLARGSTSAGPSTPSGPSATGSSTSTASCWPPTRTGPPSSRSSAWPGWCSPTSRTTTSTSSTGATRCCGARCASSAASWPRRASSGLRRHLPAQAGRGPRGPVGLLQRLGGRDPAPRPAYWGRELERRRAS